MPDSPAQDAYTRAETAIAEALANKATELDLSGHAGFEDLAELPPQIAQLTGLRSLYLINTGIADATPLAGLTDLQTLDLDNTGIADATPLAGLTGLQALILDNTGIVDATPLAGLTGLQTLSLDNTGIADATPFAALSGLQTLSLNNTRLADATPLEGLTGLKFLSLKKTGIKDATPLAGLTGLQALILNTTGIADATAFAGLTGLRSLSLNNTSIADATPLARLTNLRSLDLSNTGIADATQLAGLTSLQDLYLTGTGIADATPLAGLTGLQTLYLDQTVIADATPLAGLTGLENLHLGGTGIADLRPLLGLSGLADSRGVVGLVGLSFAGCAATHLDPRLATLAAIEDNSERTRRTLAYLNEVGDDWPPARTGVDPETSEAGAPPVAERLIDRAAFLLRTAPVTRAAADLLARQLDAAIADYLSETGRNRLPDELESYELFARALAALGLSEGLAHPTAAGSQDDVAERLARLEALAENLAQELEAALDREAALAADLGAAEAAGTTAQRAAGRADILAKRANARAERAESALGKAHFGPAFYKTVGVGAGGLLFTTGTTVVYIAAQSLFGETAAFQLLGRVAESALRLR